MRALSLALFALLSLFAAVALAHPTGGPAVAWPNEPKDVCEHADQSYLFTWADSNFLNTSTTGTITIDWYYTRRMPATVQLGVTPPDLEGTHFFRVDEEDRHDFTTWDTSSVAAGSYFLYSRVNDLPTETMSIKIIAFSRGTVCVVHPGDPEPVSLILVQPIGPFDIADESYNVVFNASDPNHTGRIKLEAMQRRDGSDAVLIADDIPATETGTVPWDTSDLPIGDWILKGTIRDARGQSFTAYSRYLLRVEHLAPLDAGPRIDAGRRDTGLFFDGGTGDDETDGRNTPACGCNTSGKGGSFFALFALLILARARSVGSSRRADRSRSDFRRPPE